MKRIWIFLMAMLSIVSFTGCDMTEDLADQLQLLTMSSIGLILLTTMDAVCLKD